MWGKKEGWQKETTDLERCCFHQVSWASNEHLSFSSEVRVSVPRVLPVTHQWRVCVCVSEWERERGPMCIGVTMVKPIYCTKMHFTLSPLFSTPITVLSLNPTCTIHDKDLHILILFRHVCTYFFGCFFFFIFFSFKGFVQGKKTHQNLFWFPQFRYKLTFIWPGCEISADLKSKGLYFIHNNVDHSLNQFW